MITPPSPTAKTSLALVPHTAFSVTDGIPIKGITAHVVPVRRTTVLLSPTANALVDDAAHTPCNATDTVELIVAQVPVYLRTKPVVPTANALFGPLLETARRSSS